MGLSSYFLFLFVVIPRYWRFWLVLFVASFIFFVGVQVGMAWQLSNPPRKQVATSPPAKKPAAVVQRQSAPPVAVRTVPPAPRAIPSIRTQSDRTPPLIAPNSSSTSADVDASVRRRPLRPAGGAP